MKPAPEPQGPPPQHRAEAGAAHLMAVVHGGDNLPEEMPGFALAEPLPFTDVVV